MSFLKKLFGSSKEHACLAIHDDLLEAFQFRPSGDSFELAGANRLPLEKGIVEEGVVKRETAFRQIVRMLFSQAEPHPIRAKHLYVNIPFSQTYPFIETFSLHSKKEHREKGLREFVEAHAPFALGRLTVDTYEKETPKGFICQACAYPKLWAHAVHKACSEMDFGKLHFISEPAAQTALADIPELSHYALFSRQDGMVFLSLFYYGLLYDTFPMETVLEKGGKGADGLLAESKKEFDSFKKNLEASIDHCYFAGLPSAAEKSLKAGFEAICPITFLEEADHSLSSILPEEDYSTTLIGLALNLLKNTHD